MVQAANLLNISVIEFQEVEISNVPEGEYEVEVIDPMEHMFDNLMKKINSNPALETSSASAKTVALQPEAGSLHTPSSLESREHSIIRQVDETYLTENTVLLMRLKKDIYKLKKVIDELKTKKIAKMEELLELESKKEEARAKLEALKTDIRDIAKTYLTENTVLVMRLKKVIDELKTKKIAKMEELLELKSKKEEARAELEAIKTDIAKHQTVFSSLKQFNDQTEEEERERGAATLASARVLLPPASDPSSISPSSSTSTSAQPQPQLQDLVNHDGQPQSAAGAKTPSHPQPAQLVPASAGVSPVLAYKSSEAVQQRPVESCAQQQRQQQLHTRPQLHPHPHPLQHQQQLRQHNIPAMAQQQLQQHWQKAATLSSPLAQYVPQVAPGPGHYRGPATLPLETSTSGLQLAQSPMQATAMQTLSIPAEVRRSPSGSLQEVIRSALGSGALPQEDRRSASGSLTSPDPSQDPPPVIIRPRAFCREVPPDSSAAKPRAVPKEATVFMPRKSGMSRLQEAAAPQPGVGSGLARRQDPTSATVMSIMGTDTPRAK